MTRTAGSASASSMAASSSSRSAGVIVLYSPGRASTIERTPASVSVRSVFIGAPPARSCRAPRAPGEARGARQRLAGADHLGAAAELVPHRLLERHPPLLVGGQAIGAKTALREASELMRELDRGVARPPALDQAVREAHAERLLARDAAPREDHVHGLAVADEVREEHRAQVEPR